MILGDIQNPGRCPVQPDVVDHALSEGQGADSMISKGTSPNCSRIQYSAVGQLNTSFELHTADPCKSSGPASSLTEIVLAQRHPAFAVSDLALPL